MPAASPSSWWQRPRFWAVLLAVIVLAINLASIASTGAWDPWETHYGEVARNILLRHDPIDLWWQAGNGGPDATAEKAFWSKPALPYWLMALSMKVFGVGTAGPPNEMVQSFWPEMAIRLPSMIAGLGSAALLGHAAWRLVSPRAGILTAIVLCTMPQWAIASRQALTDMIFAGPVVLAAVAWIMAWGQPDRALRRRGKGPRSVPWDRAYLAFVVLFGIAIIAPLAVIHQHSYDPYTWSTIGKDPKHAAALKQIQSHMFIYWGLVVLVVGLSLRWTRRSQVWMAVLYIAAGLSLLGKGMIGPGLVGAVVLSHLIVTGRWDLLRRCGLPTGIVLFALASFPWHHAMVLFRGERWVNELIIQNNLARFGSGEQKQAVGSFAFYLETLGLAALPWSAVVPLALAAVFGTRRDRESTVVTPDRADEPLPQDRQSRLDALEREQAQLEITKRWSEVVDRLRRRAELTEDPMQRKELHLQVGNLFLEKFNNQAEAITSFEAVLEDDPSDVATIEALEQLYERRRDWDRLARLRQKKQALEHAGADPDETEPDETEPDDTKLESDDTKPEPEPDDTKLESDARADTSAPIPRDDSSDEDFSLAKTPEQTRRVLHQFALLWFSVSLFAIGYSVTKYYHYLLPVLPPLALLVGLWIDGRMRGRPAALSARLVGVAVALAVLAAVVRDAFNTTSWLAHLTTYLYTGMWRSGGPEIPALPWLMLPFGLGLLAWTLSRYRAAMAGFVLSGLLTTGWVIEDYLPAASENWSQRSAIRIYFDERGPKDRLVSWWFYYRGETWFTKRDVWVMKDVDRKALTELFTEYAGSGASLWFITIEPHARRLRAQVPQQYRADIEVKYESFHYVLLRVPM